MKQILFLLSFFFFVNPSITLATQEMITSKFLPDAGETVSMDARLKKSGPEMAFAYLADSDRVEVWSYSQKKKQWTQDESIVVTPIDGAAAVTIENIGIIHLRTQWNVHFLARHLDANGATITTTYEAFSLSRAGSVGDNLRSYLDNEDFSDNKKTGNDFFVLPMDQEKGNSYFAAYEKMSTLHIVPVIVDTDSPPAVSLEDMIDSEKKYVVLPMRGKRDQIQAGKNSAIVGVVDKKLTVATIGYEKELKIIKEFEADEIITLVDAQWAPKEKLHLVFDRDGKMVHTIIDVKKGSARTLEKIGNGFVYNEEKNVASAYQKYGKGKYILAWSTEKALQYRVFRPSKGWGKKHTVSVSQASSVSPSVLLAGNGYSAILWNDDGVTQHVRYLPKKKKWTSPQSVEKKRGSTKIISPADSLPSSVYGTYYTTVKKQNGSQEGIYRWNFDAAQKELQRFFFEKKYTLLEHRIRKRDGDEYYFAILQKGKKITAHYGNTKTLFGY